MLCDMYSPNIHKEKVQREGGERLGFPEQCLPLFFYCSPHFITQHNTQLRQKFQEMILPSCYLIFVFSVLFYFSAWIECYLLVLLIFAMVFLYLSHCFLLWSLFLFSAYFGPHLPFFDEIFKVGTEVMDLRPCCFSSWLLVSSLSSGFRSVLFSFQIFWILFRYLSLIYF